MPGFALAAVGIDTVTGTAAPDLRLAELLNGLRFPDRGDRPVRHRRDPADDGGGARVQGRLGQASTCSVVLETWKELPRYWLTSLRSSAGRLLDGHHAGRRDAGLLHELRRGQAAVSKDGDKFGTGQVEGVVAPETAAHAAGTTALLPMLTLGVPGSPTAAVLLGGLLIWGLQPGPLLFVEQKDFVWGLIASMYLGNIAGLIVVLTCVPLFAVDPAHPVLDHRAGHRRDLRDRRLHGAQLDVRRLDDDGVRRRWATSSRSSTIRWRRWCSRSCWATAPRTPSGSRCSMSQGDMSIFFSNGLVGSITGLGAGPAVLAAGALAVAPRARESISGATGARSVRSLPRSA